MVFTFLVCTYCSRKSLVKNLLRRAENQRFFQLLRDFLQDMPLGVAIVSAVDPTAVLLQNRAAENVLAETHTTNVTEGSMVAVSLDSALLRREVRLDMEKRNGSQIVLEDFVKQMDEGGRVFMELSDKVIEVRARRGPFEGKESVFLTLVDCSLAQRLEKVKAESHYKTMVMSTVSHELRAPVSAVLGCLENISGYIPKEGQEYLEIAKNSCCMLSYQINDMTVPCLFPYR